MKPGSASSGNACSAGGFQPQFVPSLAGIMTLFSRTATAASLWLHLVAGNLFAARAVFLEGRLASDAADLLCGTAQAQAEHLRCNWLRPDWTRGSAPSLLLQSPMLQVQALRKGCRCGSLWRCAPCVDPWACWRITLPW